GARGCGGGLEGLPVCGGDVRPMRDYREVPLWREVTPQEWTDWKWQVRNRLRSVEELRQVINLTAEEEEGLRYANRGFPVGINPYYAMLMDPDDPSCPIR